MTRLVIKIYPATNFKVLLASSINL